MEAKQKNSSARKLVDSIRTNNTNVPIYIITDRKSLHSIPTSLLAKVNGYLFAYEEKTTVCAMRVSKAIDRYIETLLPTFFGGLLDYVENYTMRWHTPGHLGGQAFLKSPSGRLFHSFFGENSFRADLSISVPELGSLLEHTGMVGDAERNAAKVFNSNETYFVLNGTSTANKMVVSGTVHRGDVVLIDRNCHKSLCHSLMLTGAIPIYFLPNRNAFGIIGGIPEVQSTPEWIRSQIESSELVKRKYGKDLKNVKVKYVVITNSTYDGIVYSAKKVFEKLQRSGISNLHFDEAWFAYAHFNPLYKDCYGMSLDPAANEDLDAVVPTIFATQSTHKLMAAFSQSSTLHVKARPSDFNADQFNETVMMYSSTSPQYSMIASLDVATKMVEGNAGLQMTQEIIDEAVVFRQKMAQITKDIWKTSSLSKAIAKQDQDKWWFSLWQPDGFTTADSGVTVTSFDKISRDKLATTKEFWSLLPSDTWHGFSGLTKDFLMLDPIKVTFLTPGIGPDGKFLEWGIPAPLVSRFLMDVGIVDEKTGFYSMLALFSFGVTKGQSSVLLHSLFDFKRLFDTEFDLEDAIPSLTKDFPHRYPHDKYTLKTLAKEMHSCLKEHNVTKVTSDAFSILPTQVMTPGEAYEYLVDKRVELVPLEQITGRVIAVMIAPYPPGIPIAMPGEVIDTTKKIIIDYLLILKNFNERFPGFETEIHGVKIETSPSGEVQYLATCLTEEAVQHFLATRK